MCVLNHVWLFATLWTVACQAPLSMGLFRQWNSSGLPFPPPGDLPYSGIKLLSPALQACFLSAEPSGKTMSIIFQLKKLKKNCHGALKVQYSSWVRKVRVHCSVVECFQQVTSFWLATWPCHNLCDISGHRLFEQSAPRISSQSL